MPQAAILGVTLALSAIGTATKFIGQRQEAKAAEQAAEFNAKIEENAAIKEELEGREQRHRDRIAGKAFRSRQRARIAKSGVTLEGSPLELLAQSATNEQLAISDSLRATGISADISRGRAEIERFGGRTARRAGGIASAGTLLSGARRIAGRLPARRTAA